VYALLVDGSTVEIRPAEPRDFDAVKAAGSRWYSKADVPGLVHKTDAGGVELDLRTETDVRAAYQRLTERFGSELHAVLVQPMIGDGTEVMVGVADDHLFGPLVVFGLGGVATEVLADHAARLTPLPSPWPGLLLPHLDRAVVALDGAARADPADPAAAARPRAGLPVSGARR